MMFDSVIFPFCFGEGRGDISQLQQVKSRYCGNNKYSFQADSTWFDRCFMNTTVIRAEKHIYEWVIYLVLQTDFQDKCDV